MTASGSLRRFNPTREIFPPRCKELLAIEGWYSTAMDNLNITSNLNLTRYPMWARKPTAFKISCRFNDMMRASVFWGHREHFSSCFAPDIDGNVKPEVLARLRNPNWAILYVADKHGNFQGRAWISWDGRYQDYVVDKMYGNASSEMIQQLLRLNEIKCRFSCDDTYLVR